MQCGENVDQKRALVEEHEQKLREKHGDKYSRFQYKLMIASGMHSGTDELPAASMFGRTPKRQKVHSLKHLTLVMLL